MKNKHIDLIAAPQRIGEKVAHGLCLVGILAEVLIAAGGDAPVADAVRGSVTMHGFRTGISIAGWMVVASFTGRFIDHVMRFRRENPWKNGLRFVNWRHFPWFAFLSVVLVTVCIFYLRFTPFPMTVVISN